MRRKRWLSLLLCVALAVAVLPALPPATALAADVELEVLHAASGNLAAEITDALGGGDEAPYTKLRIIIGSAELSGNYESGDWKTLYGMGNILPNVTSLELVYMSGSRTVPDYALYNQSSNTGAAWLKTLTMITAGGQLTGVGDYAFSHCTNLETLSLPATIGVIGERAFSSCSGLDGTLVIPSSATEIGYGAFTNCTGLDTLFLPESGSLTIGEEAFYGCSGLDGTLTIPSSVTSIAGHAFYNCYGLDALSLPATGSLTIGIYAFRACTGLDGTLTIPSSVTEIGYEAFSRCSGLDALSLPESGSLSIGSYAFMYCNNIKGVVYIPSSVTEIDSGAFYGSDLDALVFQNNVSAPAMTSYTITGSSQITAYYPASAEASYLAQSGLPTPRVAYDDTTARIISFRINGVGGTIDETEKTVTLDLPAGTDLLSLTPEIGIIGASIDPASGAAQDFSSHVNTYTVTPASGSAVAYTVTILGRPVIAGSNELSGVVGNVGDQSVTATITGSYPENIVLSASVGGKYDISSRVGDGVVTFNFPASLINDLAVDKYSIQVTAEATAHNASVASTLIGSLSVTPPVPVIESTASTVNSVTISWNAVSDADWYRIYLYNSNEDTYTLAATTSGESFTFTGRSSGTTYSYAVCAYDSGVYSAYSSVVSVTTLPAAPSYMHAASAGYDRIRLTWAKVKGATGYEIYRATSSGGTYSLVKRTRESSYTDTGLTTGKTYYYKVRAYGTFGSNTTYGDFSDVKTARPIPSTPTLTAKSSGYASIKLTWKKVSGATGYRLYRATSKTGKYSLVKKTTATSYTNTGRTTGKYYYYKVRAYRTVGSKTTYGKYSSVKAAKAIPSTPTLKAKSASYRSIKLTWTKVSGATGYRLYRATSKTGKYSLVKKTTATSYTNTGRTTGKYYYYKVRAYRTVGSKTTYGNYSSVKAAKPVPAKPTSVKAVRASSKSIRITWRAVSGATRYQVYRATSRTGTYKRIATTSNRSYTNTGLKSGKYYYYKVRAYHLEGSTKVYGYFSSVVYAKP